MFTGDSAFQMGSSTFPAMANTGKANPLGASKRMTASQDTEPPRLLPAMTAMGHQRSLATAPRDKPDYHVEKDG
jgi:hypothetical protein